MIITMESAAMPPSSGSVSAVPQVPSVPGSDKTSCNYIFLSTKYMQGIVLVGVSSSQEPEFVVGSLARICRGVLPEAKYQGFLLTI